MMDEVHAPHRHRHAHDAPEHGRHGTGGTHHEVNLDGRMVSVHDRTPTGRQIRDAGALAPASAFVLIMAAGGGTRAIGLDVRVDLAEIDGGLFRSFESDTIHEFTVDERGFEWGADTIPARDVRLFGRIHQDREIVLDVDGGRVILDDGDVPLGHGGAGRIFTRPRQVRTEIVVNTRRKTVEGAQISFEQLVTLAYPTPIQGEGQQFTVQYTRGVEGRPSGTLIETQTVRIRNGMEFDVTPTNRS